MTTDNSTGKPGTEPGIWERFSRTLEIHYWDARLRDEGFFDPLGTVDTVESFDLRQLAASPVAEPTVPIGELIIDPTDNLAMLVAAKQGRLTVTLQTRGSYAMERLSRRWVRIVSGNAAIDTQTSFDDEGQAVITLADTTDVRTGLADLRVDALEFHMTSGADAGDET
ncbi:hypothetical protein [Niveispirillum sp.]|uniref:hypothetical protein n=1 Tax=Niveispirillum sp. TaxID=1917217 RepID=UPI001B3F20AE|nr:hypothetical protein [Niveispirillum sp.]MBP7335888.1 hypothetical protein [Niveispirillum sp.]